MLYNNSYLEKCPNKLYALKRPSHSHIPRISNWHSTWKSLCTKYYNTGKKLQVFLLISLFVSFPKLKLPERRCQPCWLWTWGRVCLAGWLRSSWTIIIFTWDEGCPASEKPSSRDCVARVSSASQGGRKLGALYRDLECASSFQFHHPIVFTDPSVITSSTMFI